MKAAAPLLTLLTATLAAAQASPAALPRYPDWMGSEVSAAEVDIRALADQGRAVDAARRIELFAVPKSGRERARALLNRAALRVLVSDAAGAEKDLRAALEASPKNFAALCAMTQFLREHGRLSESRTYGDLLQAADPGPLSRDMVEKLLQRAETLMVLRDYPAAETDVRAALTIDPKSFPTLWILQRAYWATGRQAEALAAADRLVALAERSSSYETSVALSERAVFLLQSGAEARALEDLRRAVVADPGSIPALEGLARRLLEMGRAREALEFVDRSVRAGKIHSIQHRTQGTVVRAVGLVLRAQALSQLGDAAAAEESFRAALRLDERDARTLEAYARWLIQERRGAQALALNGRFQAAAREGEQGLRVRAGLQHAAILLLTGDEPGAEAALRSAVDAEPEGIGGLRELSRFLAKRGRNVQALEFNARLLKASAGEPAAARAEALVQAAGLRRLLGDANGAEESLRLALREAPGYGPALQASARAAIDAGRVSEGLAFADLAVSLSSAAAPSERGAARLRRGRLRLEAGDREGAAADLAAAVEAAPADADALEAYANGLLDWSRASEALAINDRLLRVLRDASPIARARLQRGRILLQLGDPAQGEEELRAAVSAEPDGPLPLEAYGRFLLDMRRVPQALALNERLLKAAESADPATRAHARLQRAEICSLQGDAAGEEAQLFAALAAAPSGATALRALSLFLARRGRSAEALTHSAGLIRASASGSPSERAEARVHAAAVRRELGDAAGAAEELRLALRESPVHGPALRASARAAIDAGRTADGLGFADRAVEASAVAAPSERGAAYLLRGRLRLELGDRNGAEKDLSTAVEAAPENIEALEIYAELLMKRGRAAEAFALNERRGRAAQGGPPGPRVRARLQRAEFLLLRGDDKGAEAELRAAVAQDADGAAAPRELLLFLARRGRRAQALPADGSPARPSPGALSARADARVEAAAVRRERGDASGEAEELSLALLDAPGHGPALRASARAAIDAGRMAEGTACADRFVALVSSAAPAERGSALLWRGRLRLKMGDRAGAERDLSSAAVARPEDPVVWGALAELRLAAGAWSKALAAAERMVVATKGAGESERAAALLTRGEARVAAGDAAGAGRDLRAAAALRPEETVFRRAAARALRSPGGAAQALSAAEAYAARAGSASERIAAASLRAQALFALGRERQVEPVLRQALSSAPNDRELLSLLLRVIRLQNGKEADALSVAESLVRLSSAAPAAQRAEARRALAETQSRLGLNEEAAAELTRALADAPDSVETLLASALLARERGRIEESLAYAEKARAALGPAGGPGEVVGEEDGDPGPRGRLAALLLSAGRPKQAAALLVGAVSPRLLVVRALARAALADDAGTRADLRAALQADAATACGETPRLLDRGRLDLRYFDLCLERFPGDAALLNDRGVARHLSGDARAVDDLRTVLLREPGRLDAAVNLATVLAGGGRAAEAVAALEAARKASSRRGGDGAAQRADALLAELRRNRENAK